MGAGNHTGSRVLTIRGGRKILHANQCSVPRDTSLVETWNGYSDARDDNTAQGTADNARMAIKTHIFDDFLLIYTSNVSSGRVAPGKVHRKDGVPVYLIAEIM